MNKILLLNDHMEKSGIGKYTFNIYRILLQEKDAKYSYHLLLQNMKKSYNPKTPNTTLQPRIISPNSSGFSEKYDILSYYYFPKKIPHGYSLYHISSQMMGRSVEFVSPTVITCHDLIPFKFSSNHTLIHRYIRQKHIKSMINADAIIFISEHSKQEFFSLFDYDEKKTFIIHHGVDNIFNQRDKSKSRETLNLPLKRSILLHVGTDQPRKNIVSLLHTLKIIKRNIPNILLIRKGRMAKKTGKLINKLNLSSNIIFIKQKISENKIALLYNAADILVFPSTYEGFGFPVLEALKSGCPVVASNATSIPEIAGDAAILHEPSDINGFAKSIEKLLMDESARDKLISKGLKQAEKFTWEIAAQKTSAVYRKLIN